MSSGVPSRRVAIASTSLRCPSSPYDSNWAIDADASHASWLENFPWTRLPGVAAPYERKPMTDIARLRGSDPAEVRQLLGDGSLGGLYERPDEDVLRVWAAGVAEVRELIESGWRA